MQSRPWRASLDRLFQFAWVCAILWFAAPCAAAEEPAIRALQLEVFINGASTGFIAPFAQFPDGRLTIKRAELAQVGVRAPGRGDDQSMVGIGDSAGLPYTFDERRQRIDFKLADSMRVPKRYDLRGSIDAPPAPVAADVGAVLNYELFASAAQNASLGAAAFSGGSATLDGRVFGPFGVASQSAILSLEADQQTQALRLDTAYVYSDPKTEETFRAGDVTTNALSWTRSVRLGGLQFQRDFALRPDLITAPLPTVSGSAAVPSTLDLLVNNVKLFSQQIPAGPYQIANVPIISSSGTAQLVMRDAAGRQIQTSAPFYVSPLMLRPGLTDFSFEAGAPRLLYAVQSNDYAPELLGSASLRRGFDDALTVEAHAEGGAHLQNGGAGVLVNVASRGVVSFAATASRSDNGIGAQSYVAFDTTLGSLNFHACAQHAFDEYDDIASIVGDRRVSLAPLPPWLAASAVGQGFSSRPPRDIDSVVVGLPLPALRAQASLGFVRLRPFGGTTSQLLTFSFSLSLPANASLAFLSSIDLAKPRDANLFASFAMPLETEHSKVAPDFVSTGVTRSSGKLSGFAEASRNMSSDTGSLGWRVRDSEGGDTERYASASYRSDVGTVSATAQQSGGAGFGSLEAQGSIAAMDGGVFATNRIDDAFAVVDAGAPNVAVLYENRPAAVTNSQGLALIPTLRSYQTNRIDIDPQNLPVNAEVSATRNVVAPSNKGGVVVKFGVDAEPRSAVVILQLSDKSPPPVGAAGRLEGSGQTFLVGYDGEAFIRGLKSDNTIVVSTGAGECRAQFAFAPKSNAQVRIGPVLCR